GSHCENGGNERRKEEDTLVCARRDDRFLEDELQQVGEGLEQAPGTDNVRAATKLHRRPDLAIRVKQVSDDDQQYDEQNDRLQRYDKRGQDVSCKNSFHCSVSLSLTQLPVG